ncbi:MAG TPA: carboxypeptidase-like regulatory domain-containing protein [Thermoanaerobaculaceae bacterium]|nr:carboxypeptidase-like regulatory domain-containing protein [Thermoanaerobaculaceae bacterium]
MLRIHLAGPAPEGAWVEAAPLISSAPSRFLAVPTAKREVSLLEVAAGPLMVCVGARDLATSCARKVGSGDYEAPALVSGLRVGGRFVQEGKPVEGVRVSLVPPRLTGRRPFTIPRSWDGKRVAREVVSGADGRFAMPRVQPGEYIAQYVPPGGRIETTPPFTVAAAESSSRARGRSQQEGIDLGDITLEGGLKVPVLVIDKVGTPLAGARVGAHQGTAPNVVFFEAASDEKGQAALAGLDPAQPLAITCAATGFATLRQTFESLPAGVACALQALGTVTGTVVDADGDPISGATAALRRTPHRVTSDERGDFRLGEVAAGVYALLVSAPGFDTATSSIEVQAGETTEVGQVELTPGTDLQGLVRDSQSRAAVAGAVVACASPPGLGETTSDADGAFVISLPRSEPSVLTVSADGYPVVSHAVVAQELGATAPVVIELSKGGSIHVSAWDDDSGEPCGGCQVDITAPNVAQELMTDANGEATSGPLAPRAYDVLLEGMVSLGSVFKRSGGSAERWVEVKAGVTTNVQLGSPLVPITVRFLPAPTPEWRPVGNRPSGVSLGESRGGGEYSMKYRRGEPMNIWLDSARGAHVSVGAVPDDFRGSAVEFQLPQTDVRAQLMAGTKPPVTTEVDLVAYATGRVAASVLTSPDGTLDAAYLPPGVYIASVAGRVVATFILGDSQALDLGQVQLSSP